MEYMRFDEVQRDFPEIWRIKGFWSHDDNIHIERISEAVFTRDVMAGMQVWAGHCTLSYDGGDKEGKLFETNFGIVADFTLANRTAKEFNAILLKLSQTSMINCVITVQRPAGANKTPRYYNVYKPPLLLPMRVLLEHIYLRTSVIKT